VLAVIQIEGSIGCEREEAERIFLAYKMPVSWCFIQHLQGTDLYGVYLQGKVDRCDLRPTNYQLTRRRVDIVSSGASSSMPMHKGVTFLRIAFSGEKLINWQ
jgi:hypothetical protein